MTTKPDTETAKLRGAINEMNEQPDISANDSPRLRELCRVTTMEIKAVGGVSAATSLEMIGYIRELERSRVGKDDHVAWCRYEYNPEGGIQSIVTCDSDAKGAFKVYRAAPSDFEQLIRLRKAAEKALMRLEENESWWGDLVPRFKDNVFWRATFEARHEACKREVAALREALAHTGEQS